MVNRNDSAFSDRWVNLAEQRLGTEVLFANDDFFAEKENLILPQEPVFIADKFTDRGKWMDGWETRRRRTSGHDFAILRLGLSGRICGVDIDTRHFNGNEPQHASLDAACLQADPNEHTRWTNILPKQALGPSAQHLIAIDCPERWTHVRLNIFPDGGVARLRVYGEVMADWHSLKKSGRIDLAAVQNEGRVIASSDMHFGHRNNLIAPGRGIHMGDGWETRRRRGIGYDWVLVALGRRGSLEKIVVDTAHFKGNYPHSCRIEACDSDRDPDPLDPTLWREILPDTLLSADCLHEFKAPQLDVAFPVSHLRLCIYPDGGVSRLRVIGVPDA